MAKDKNEGLDSGWAEHVRRVGLNYERLDAYIERITREGTMRLKKLSYRFDGSQWLIVLTAEVDGKDVVQFANVDSLAGSAGKLVNLLQQPIWKADKFSSPAPHNHYQQLELDIDKGAKKL